MYYTAVKSMAPFTEMEAAVLRRHNANAISHVR